MSKRTMPRVWVEVWPRYWYLTPWKEMFGHDRIYTWLCFSLHVRPSKVVA